ncbi:MAG TPA: hypothetical protein P5318_10645 [Candidatus Hydrogenedentes bacterium]|mgnify:CR=1 FL=1|nr:hypothetical protein [Candidatus Hydrogenedentota bacterium]HRT20572.1 hypothetical protein [Candidatus Hydrogenedentota bacterium]HRT65223.1 hypothetical protein [Candidatus Hydrogenedentota bacterium]
MKKPKIGLLFLAGDSWWDAGVCDAKEGPYAGFLDLVRRDCRAAAAALSETADVVATDLLHTVEETIAAARFFNAQDLDAILFCPIIWTNDRPVVAFIQEARRVPVMLWAHDPYGRLLPHYHIEEWLRASGPVSVQQCSNIFRRFGWAYESVFGSEKDPRTLRRIHAFAAAAAVRSGLRGTRIAVLPAPCQMVMSTWADAFHLLERFGVELLHVSVEEYARLVDGISDNDVDEYEAYLRALCPITGVTDDELRASARHALAMVRLTEENGLSGIAIEDFHPEFYRRFGFRPHLAHPKLGEFGCIVGMEADVPGILSALIASRLANRPGMFNEFFTIDRDAGAILMGHPGYGEPAFGDPATFMVTRDLEFDPSQPAGAWLSYRAKPGPMTFFNLTPECGNLKATAFRGVEEGGPRLMDGYAHMLVRISGRVERLFERIVQRGLIQHWGTVHGDVMPELECFARMTGLDLVVLDE